MIGDMDLQAIFRAARRAFYGCNYCPAHAIHRPGTVCRWWPR